MNHSVYYTTDYIKDNFGEIILDGIILDTINNPDELADFVYELLTEETIDYKFGVGVEIVERAVNQFLKGVNWKNIYESIKNRIYDEVLLEKDTVCV